MTASVLVRRGLGDEAEARRFLEGALPGHDPFALGDMREAVETIVAAVEAGARICVHGDYDADGICATALAVLLLRELERRRRLASALAVRGGVRPERPDADAARRGGLRPRPDGRLRHHGRRRGRARALARARGRRHRSPPSGRDVPGLSRRRAAEGRLSRSRASAAPASSGSSRRRSSVPTIRSCSVTSTSSRSRPSPTSCRSSTRTARSRCSACAGSPRRRRSGLRALMRVGGVDPGGDRRVVDRFPARAAHQRVRAALPARGRARAAADRGRRRGARRSPRSSSR